MKLTWKLGLVYCWICSFSSATSAQMLRTVAFTDDHAPGTTSGVNYSSFFGPPVLNSAGQTAFPGRLKKDGVVDDTNDRGIWSEGSGLLTLVARAGNHAPGTPSGVDFREFVFDSLVLNSAGQTSFRAFLDVGLTNGAGIWSEGSGSLALVVREGIRAPGTPSGVKYGSFSSYSDFAMNSAGQTVFPARLLAGSGEDFTNDTGIWLEGSGSIALVAREGEQAPDTPSGVNFGDFSTSDLVLNSAGQTAFQGRLTGSGIDSSNDRGIWSEGFGSLGLVAREGDHAPGTPSGVNYGNLFAPVLNSAGQVAFLGVLTGSGVNSTNTNGIWSEGSGSLDLVARAGDQAPGTPNDVKYRGFSIPVLNSTGQTAFFGRLTGNGVNVTNEDGIWSEGSGSLGLVTREGDHAPGTPRGVNFHDFFPSSVALNSAGQTAFLVSSLVGSGVDFTNNEGIWAEDRTGLLRLIAREGDLLEVAPDDFRTIRFLTFVGNTGNEDGRPSGFNDLGQLAFFAAFTDGTQGIFVSDVATVPEPTSLLLVASAIALLFLISSLSSVLSLNSVVRLPHPNR